MDPFKLLLLAAAIFVAERASAAGASSVCTSKHNKSIGSRSI